MKKLLILLMFFGIALVGRSVQAQYCTSLGCGGGSGYYYNLAAYTYFWEYADKYQKAAYATDMFFGAVYMGIVEVEASKALERHIAARRNNLENYKSIKRYYTEGIPPFATRGPDGRPRSPKITWDDVESIGLE